MISPRSAGVTCKFIIKMKATRHINLQSKRSPGAFYMRKQNDVSAVGGRLRRGCILIRNRDGWVGVVGVVSGWWVVGVVGGGWWVLRMLRHQWNLSNRKLAKTKISSTSVRVGNGLHRCSKLYNMPRMISCGTVWLRT